MLLNKWYDYGNPNSGIDKYKRMSGTRFSILYKNGNAYDYAVKRIETVDDLMLCGEKGKGMNSMINNNRKGIHGKWIRKYKVK